MTETILVTGGTGYLGSRICDDLARMGATLVVLKRSTSSISKIKHLEGQISFFDVDERPLTDIFRQFPTVHSIVHCATVYGRQQESIASMADANLMLPLRLLTLAVENGVKSFLNSDTFLSRELNPYSLSKKQFVDWMKLYSGRIVCCNMRLEHFYGPGDDCSKFVSWLISQFQNNAPVINLTPGYQTRDFVYIDDVVEAYRFVLEYSLSVEPTFEVFDVGTGNETSIRELVAKIQRGFPESNCKPCFNSLPYRENELMQAQPDISRLLSLGWRPSVSLETGLKRMIDKTLAVE